MNYFDNFIIGAVIAPTALFLNAFASFQLPESLQKLSPLIPALQSNWLMMHVTVMLLSYATLICGCILAITFLFLFESQFENIFNNAFFARNMFNKDSISTKKQQTEWSVHQVSQRGFIPQYESYLQKGSSQPLNSTPMNFSSGKLDFPVGAKAKLDRKSNLLETNQIGFSSLPGESGGRGGGKLLKKLDQLSFRSIGIGFPFLTIGILSGSVWANEAWGSYWNWDPKETWSLITWLIFAIYLHLRLTQNWNGFKSAILATIGFFSVWICFLGVNFLAKGLHSYGWFHS